MWTGDKKTATREFINTTSTGSRLEEPCIAPPSSRFWFNCDKSSRRLGRWRTLLPILSSRLRFDLDERSFLGVKNYAIGIYKGNWLFSFQIFHSFRYLLAWLSYDNSLWYFLDIILFFFYLRYYDYVIL